MHKCFESVPRAYAVTGVLLALSASGCASTGVSDFRYNAPQKLPVQNEILTPRNFESVWDILVRELSKSFFVINNIEKASRLINLTFSTQEPEKYIDCGASFRTYDRGGEHAEYEYQTAASSSFKMAGRGGEFGNLPVTYLMNRKTDLEGRINIVVTPQGESTLVSVNCRYVFSVQVNGVWIMENAFGVETQRGKVDATTSSLNLSTLQPGTDDWGTPGNPNMVTCQSTGKLENEILDMVRQ